jgi:hypothetical protein
VHESLEWDAQLHLHVGEHKADQRADRRDQQAHDERIADDALIDRTAEIIAEFFQALRRGAFADHRQKRQNDGKADEDHAADKGDCQYRVLEDASELCCVARC